MGEADRHRWDQRHGDPDAPPAVVGPPRCFADWTSRLPSAGRALELACGTGGASVWLARRGLEVCGVDVSPVAVEQARSLARTHGVADRCSFDVADLDEGLPAGPPVELIVCHLFRDARLDREVVARLAPGGLLAVAALSEVGAGARRSGSFRVRPGALPAAFADLEVLATDEGGGAARLLARRITPVA